MSTFPERQQSAQQIPLQPSEPELHIASVIVHSEPGSMPAVKVWLTGLAGVEVHAEDERGKLVAVIETQRAQDILDLIDSVQEQPGALNAALVYHEILTPEEDVS